ncbi:CdaR family protein [Anaerovibrio sp.]|uniref:CdaR family protein n=1 Tax=Anaerovibrio sp. TaxID=1872532 RepID=UPI003F156D2F
MMVNVRNLFRRNLPVKVLALIAAVIMWGYVMNEENPSVNATYTVPVEIVNAPEGYDVNMNVKEVRLKVRAPRALMATVHEADFKAVIDLSGNTEGEYEERIKAMVPQGFELLELSDEVVNVSMESLIAHGVPVEIAVSGKPAQGMDVGRVQPVQQYVNVYGPRHLVESIVKATGKIKLSDNTADFTMRVRLTAVDADGNMVNNLSVLPTEMDVTVQLVPGMGKKIVTVKPVVNGILPEGYKLGGVTAEPAQVEISGPTRLLADIKSLDTEPVSLAGMTESSSSDAALVLPDGVTAANKTVSISIKVNKK